MSHSHFLFLILLVYSFIIYLYFWCTYLVQILGIQVVNMHGPHPVNNLSVALVFYSTLPLRPVFLTPPPPQITHRLNVTHTQDWSLAEGVFLQGGLSPCSVFPTIMLQWPAQFQPPFPENIPITGIAAFLTIYCFHSQNKA